MSTFDKTDKNKIKRLPKRGDYDKKAVYEIVDASLIGHVGIVQDGAPIVIPTLIARDEDTLLLHGAATSRLMNESGSGIEVCVSVTHVDGLVLARSVFHHSVNYRSAVLFGTGHMVTDPDEKMKALEAFTEKLIPGRWDDSRLPYDNELKATAVVALPIDLASAKIRVGDPGDDEEDINLPYWSGVLPMQTVFGEPIDAPNLPDGIPVPDYVNRLIS